MLLKQHDLCIESHINEPPHYLKTEPTLSYHHSQSLNNVTYSLVTPLTKNMTLILQNIMILAYSLLY